MSRVITVFFQALLRRRDSGKWRGIIIRLSGVHSRSEKIAIQDSGSLDDERAIFTLKDGGISVKNVGVTENINHQANGIIVTEQELNKQNNKTERE